MHETSIFAEYAILFLTATGALILFRLIKIPAVVGYIAAGMIIGPAGLGLLGNYEQIQSIAEVGVLLLLFTIGLEVSPSRLWELRREALIGGQLQVILSAGLSGLGAYWLGANFPTAVVIGFFFSLSSTAIVLRLLSDKGVIDAPHGKNSLAVLLFQDVIVIPMAIIIPLLSGGHSGFSDVLLALAKSLGLFIVAVGASKLAIPFLLDKIVVLRSREGYLLSLITIVLGTAWVTQYAGLSPALGAFLAGLVISETEHKHLALSEAVPFRDMFMAVFFVSVGMLLDLGYMARNPLPPLLIAVAVYSLKGTIVALIFRVLGYSFKSSVKSGAALGQTGEFSMVLLFIAEANGIVSPGMIQLLLSAAAVTILMTPAMIGGADLLYHVRRQDSGSPVEAAESCGLHIALIGFGLSGRFVARVLRLMEIEYKVTEMNPQTVRQERKNGEPIILGDASKPEVLHELDVKNARAVIIAISDLTSVRPIMIRIKEQAPHCHIIVRARYVSQFDEFKRLGADEIILEDMEASLQIVTKLMDYLGSPHEKTLKQIEELRSSAVLTICPDNEVNEVSC